MSVFARFFARSKRHEPDHAGLDWDWEPAYREDAPTATMPSPAPFLTLATDYDARARQQVAELAAMVEAENTQAAVQTPQEPDPIDDPPPPPALLPPPPAPYPGDMSRIMVAQIPDPPVNDRNFRWAHQYADYMRRVGVATGTSTELEHTTAWLLPALPPGDGTGERL